MRYITTIGNLVLLALFLRFICMYGSEWEFGRYYMPRSIVRPDGRTYADGREIDPITLELIRGDREEVCCLFMLGILACVVVVGSVSLYLGQRKFVKLNQLWMMMQEAKRAQLEGRWQEAEELLARCEAMARVVLVRK